MTTYRTRGQKVDAIRYTGTNAAAVVAFCVPDSGTIVRGTQLVCRTMDGDFVVPSGSYLFREGGMLDPDTFEDQFIEQINALTVTAVGQAGVTTTMLAGAQQDIVVPLSMEMPNATYAAVGMAVGASALAGLQVVGVTARTTTTTTVRVRNTGLGSILPASGQVTVIASGPR